MKVCKTPYMLAFLLILFIAVMAGCNNEKNLVCPDRCDPVVPDPDIQNIWPNEDGTSWHYDIVQRNWGIPDMVYWPAEQDVPPPPSLSSLALIIDSHPTGANPDTVSGIYKLAFDGMMTTESGASGQKVVKTLYVEDDGEYALGAERTGKASFLKRLLVARPDLKSKIMPYIEDDSGISVSSTTNRRPVEADPLFWPLFLNGYCWVKTDDYIGGYGDLDQLLAWKFLESNLLPGHEFTHQLVPELADDVFLHCRVLRRFDLETVMGIKGAVECLYLVDFGVWEGTDGGGSLGYSRFFDYGTIIYAAETGPVSSYERSLVQPGDPITTGISDMAITFIGTNAGDVTVVK